MWNNLEMNYRERLARVQDQERLTADLDWLKMIPTSELIKRGDISHQPNRMSLLRATLGFFGVSSTQVWKEYWQNPAAAARKSRAFAANPGAVAAWMRLGELQAQKVTCQPYDKSKFKTVLEDIRELTIQPPEQFIPKMNELCASAGVALVLVPEMKGAPLSGLTRWLTPGKAMIQLSLRYKADDQFWFSFFHEAGHVLNDRKKEVFIHDHDANGPEEQTANQFAAEFLIPSKHMSELRSLKTTTAVVAFARRLGIAPGIVVGRLQKEGIIAYSYLNRLKRRFVWSNAA